MTYRWTFHDSQGIYLGYTVNPRFSARGLICKKKILHGGLFEGGAYLRGGAYWKNVKLAWGLIQIFVRQNVSPDKNFAGQNFRHFSPLSDENFCLTKFCQLLNFSPATLFRVFCHLYLPSTHHPHRHPSSLCQTHFRTFPEIQG